MSSSQLIWSVRLFFCVLFAFLFLLYFFPSLCHFLAFFPADSCLSPWVLTRMCVCVFCRFLVQLLHIFPNRSKCHEYVYITWHHTKIALGKRQLAFVKHELQINKFPYNMLMCSARCVFAYRMLHYSIGSVKGRFPLALFSLSISPSLSFYLYVWEKNNNK